ncbi:Tetrathionate reductase subunit B precursor [Novipirellula aureliae]|uniref:Tetrathionate reductase subunit B n=1 Tax=Novipirellula aureliae TaxID=2527966 RepID=A0A5C6E1B6_9BACT|nr:TAT-variant-translocated molybdopterin oxidoreductase [Novipirellula aureliae]TWU43443.1 Tetrathionate reductase subunit B precursor [Novipirellula aureliae]
MNLYSISGLKKSGSNKDLVSGPAVSASAVSDSSSESSAVARASEKVVAPKSRYWRSLSELQDREDFQQYIDREFPVAASEFPEGVSRRRWMQLMGASLAVAGATGCRYPEETIAPFVIRPDGRVPGESYSRATNFELAGRVYNLLISCVDGRPVKVEPNTEHPTGSGTDTYAQACMLGLYDPDRARGDEGFLIRMGEKRREQATWDDFIPYGKALIRTAAQSDEGSKLAVLMTPTASPSVVRMLAALKEKCPSATIAAFDGVHGDAMRAATKQVFGKPATQVLDLAKAKVILTLQSDILGSDPGMLNNSRTFAEARNPLDEEKGMSRLYVVEGGYTTTGTMADSRLALRPSQMPAFLSELARRIDKLAAENANEEESVAEERVSFDELKTHTERMERYLEVLAKDIAAAGSDAVVVVGEHLGAEAIAAGIALNKKLGSYGTLQNFTPTVDGDLGDYATLEELVEKIDNGEVDSLIVLGGNPVATAPGNVDIASAIGKLDHSIYLGEYDDETGYICDWSLPLAHPLESWGDVVNDHGTYGVCQPQILPLLGGRPVIEVLATILGEKETEGSAIVRRTAEAIGGASLSERQWRKLLHDGYSDEIAFGGDELTPNVEFKPLTDETPVAVEVDAIDKNDFEVLFVPADGIYDGRFANNGWLQELPQTLTKLTWDNAALLSPSSAKLLGVRHGQMIALRQDGDPLELPVYELPGCAPGVVTIAIGYGRERAGMVGGYTEEDVPVAGTDINPLRNSRSMLLMTEVEARPRFRDYELATTQNHWAIDERGRDETEKRSFSLVREGTVALLKKVPQFAEVKGPHVPAVGRNDSGSLWREPINEIEEEHPKVPQWGMSIDLTKCTGCNACVVACQSENNIPIVGKEQILNSREMHWIRIDRYFQGDEENADVVQQPVACMHCETAPCEQVCPVAATVHTDDGINAMTYNRCIGTRYCANNCPFKVRRFNYFDYNKDVGVGYGIDAYPSSIEAANRHLQALVMNPEVTVRGRGVMEKCTYCIQRVEKAKIQARKDGGRPIADGDIVTACQASCPTTAIEFGNVADPNSKVSKLHADPRNYGLLSQLNLKPRTQYLARVRNPHPSLMTRAQIEDLAQIQEPHTEHEHSGHEHTEHEHKDDLEAGEHITDTETES